MKFSEVVGQNFIKRQLRANVQSNRIPHALLWVGNEGLGGLPLALAFACYLNCENRIDEDSCGECASCRKMKKMIHPDVHFIYPVVSKSGTSAISIDYMEQWREIIAENPYLSYNKWMQKIADDNKQGNISIKDCAYIIKKQNLKAFEGKNKIFIIWMPEYLGKNGNAILKIIEEPAPNTYFIFITQKEEKILNTIRSRTQIIRLAPLKDEEIAEYLIKKEKLDSKEAVRISGLSFGNLIEAEKLIKSSQSDFVDYIKEWLRCCYKPNLLEINNFTEKFAKFGREKQKEFLKTSLKIINKSMIVGFNAQKTNGILENELEFLMKFSQLLNKKNIFDIYSLLNEAHYHIERNANSKIVFFNLSLEIHKQLKIKSI